MTDGDLYLRLLGKALAISTPLTTGERASKIALALSRFEKSDVCISVDGRDHSISWLALEAQMDLREKKG